MDTLIKIIGGMIVVGGIAFVICIVMALPCMLLWNLLMPAIFGLGKITFWQSAGLCILCRILWGGSSSSSD